MSSIKDVVDIDSFMRWLDEFDGKEKGSMSEFDRMIEFLDLAWKRKDQIVPCLIGPVGIGKTAAVRQHAKNVGAKNVVTIIASQILPSEVSGITMPDASTKSMEIYDHYKLSSLEDGDILFFDELLEADQCVLSACLTLIESRMMMSGKILPDIQIIAATNPTVSPQNIKANIRQRFMFMKFSIDDGSVRDYINKKTGILLNRSVLNKLQSDANEFNILSPRSLTKICEWFDSTDDVEDATKIATMVNVMFDSTLGTEIFDCYKKSNRSQMRARNAMRSAYLASSDIKDTDTYDRINEMFEDSSLEEIISFMKSDKNWEKMEESLRSIDSPS